MKFSVPVAHEVTHADLQADIMPWYYDHVRAEGLLGDMASMQKRMFEGHAGCCSEPLWDPCRGTCPVPSGMSIDVSTAFILYMSSCWESLPTHDSLHQLLYLNTPPPGTPGGHVLRGDPLPTRCQHSSCQASSYAGNCAHLLHGSPRVPCVKSAMTDRPQKSSSKVFLEGEISM